MNRGSVAILLALLSPWSAGAADLDITVTGDFTPRIDEGDLIGDAGTDLESTHTSDSEDITLTIGSTAGASDTWRVEVRLEESPWWDAQLGMEVRRVGDGTGSGSISGGTSFQALDGTDAVFFTGAGDRDGIQIQLKLTGVSVEDVPPEVFISDIIYTVVDT